MAQCFHIYCSGDKGSVGILTRIMLTAASSLVSEVLYLVIYGWVFRLDLRVSNLGVSIDHAACGG
jgi:hypothetical protein